MAIGEHLLSHDYLDKIVYVATGNYWDKQDLMDVKDRIEMIKLVASENMIVEEQFNELPYTYQLMRKLKKKYPDDQLMIVMGADTIVRFDQWKRYKELLKYTFIVLNRDDVDVDYYMEQLGKKNYVIAKDFTPVDISSSFIRENINDYEKISDIVDKKVYQYYVEHTKEV